MFSDSFNNVLLCFVFVIFVKNFVCFEYRMLQEVCSNLDYDKSGYKIKLR